MSCTTPLKDIEDLISDLSTSRPPVTASLLKPRKPAQNPNADFEKEYLQHVPATQSIFVKTFGCSHNISDSEFMAGLLQEYGYKLVDNPNSADLLLINSCTVKNPSQDAFIGMVNTAKKAGKFLVVAGCVPQGERFIPEIEDISTIGVTQIDRVVEVVNETFKGNKVKLLGKKELPTLDLPKIRKNKFVEIIPINTGCLGACTYCKTVQARGKLGSYSPSAILARVKQSISEGVSEIWLTSEDTGAYGLDINTNIAELLKTLADSLPPKCIRKTGEGEEEELIPQVMIRLGMTNPPYMMRHLSAIAEILNRPGFFSFLHVPVQSGSDKVLEKMNREYDVGDFEKVCDFMRENVRDIMLATDIICGFPEEDEQDFDKTLDLVQKYRFPVVNISQFYPRPNTPAARMKRVNTKQVKDRSKRMTKLFESYQCFDSLKGKSVRIWFSEVETRKEEVWLVGHTKGYVKTMVRGEEGLVGKSAIVRVEKCLKWHVEGVIIGGEEEGGRRMEDEGGKREGDGERRKQEEKIKNEDGGRRREEERKEEGKKEVERRREEEGKEYLNVDNESQLSMYLIWIGVVLILMGVLLGLLL